MAWLRDAGSRQSRKVFPSDMNRPRPISRRAAHEDGACAAGYEE